MKPRLFLLIFLPFADAQTPSVTGTVINGGLPQRSLVLSLAIDFSADVAATLQKEHLTLRNLTANQLIDPALYQFTYDAPARRATWTFPTFPAGSLPEGNYLAILSARAQVPPITPRTDQSPGLGVPDYVFSFFRRFGDSDGDRDVDFLDTYRLRQTWLLSSTQPGFDLTFDGNGSGSVGQPDLDLYQPHYFTFFPPVAAIHAHLLNDTGLSLTDGLTADPTVTGAVLRPRPATTFRAALALDGTQPFPPPIDVTADLTATDTFTFPPLRLAQIRGAALDAGSYRLHLETFEAGAVTSTAEVLFTLGTAPCDLSLAAGWTFSIAAPSPLILEPVPHFD